MPLFALWSFASPWLLLWGATAALPVLIHLWNRRRYLETPWAATQFLLAAIRRHQRRIQIEQWLLLAIRASILLLLAIALAEPLISGLPGVSGRMRQPPAYTILVIDTSYSMAYEQAGTTRLSEARSQAAKLVEDAAPGDAFSLVRLADPPETIVGEPSVSHTAVLDELNRLGITNRGADLAAALEHVERLLDAAEGRFENQRVHIFSDLGKTTWSDTSSNNWRSKLTALSQRVTCQLSDVGKRVDSDNAAVTRIAAASGSVNVGVPVSVEVEVANFASHQQRRARVELSADEQRVGEQFVDLEIGGRATASFSVTFNVAGDHVLRASLGDDGLKVDNERWLSVPVRDATRVLCIQGRPHAAEYIALALQPGSEPGGLLPEVASEHAILERTLAEYDCIFLCNVARFTPDEAARLQQYVERGGGLVFVLGDLVRAELYNEQMGPESATKLLPARLNEMVSDGRHTFNPLEYRHPLTLPFRGHERAGLLTVPVWRYIRLDQVKAIASVALAFDNGDPAIIAAEAGQGKVLLVATAASPDTVDQATEPPTPWTALASWPSFPPLMHEIVRFAASNRGAQRNVLVGDLLTSRLPSGFANATGTLTPPDDNPLPIRLAGDEQVWTYGQTGQPGIYRLAFDDEAIPQALFAVNVNTVESDLEATSAEGLTSFFNEAERPNTAAQAFAERDVPLFRLALGGLLVLLVVETFLACHFGRAAR
ncbi:MAG: VWA domain-containing protein [Planctomycetota bacterium]|nr:VWA domain-containing protein [Planctomycetota bacterium]